MNSHSRNTWSSTRPSNKRPLMTSMLLVTVVLSLLYNECLSFVFQYSPPSSISVLSIKRIQEEKRKHQRLLQNDKQIISSTTLFKQKKKPRFSQQGSHIVQGAPKTKKTDSSDFKKGNKGKIKASNNRKVKRRPPIQQNQPWASGKSIDELESTMLKRWGTLDDSSRSMDGEIPEGFELFEGDEDDFETVGEYDKSVNENNFSSIRNEKYIGDGSSRWRRPVLDPWDDDEEKVDSINKKSKRGLKFTTEREYYDQDDQGFEIMGEVEDDDILFDDNESSFSSSTSSYVPRVDHLIAPRPAGGRGTNQKNAENNNEGKGYFFNPNVAATASSSGGRNEDSPRFSKEPIKKTSKYDSSMSSKEEVSDNNKRRSRPAPAKPLLDETTGKARLLTVEEAFSQFQESIDEGMMEVIETVEVPILAKKANAQSWDGLGVTSTVLLENLQYDMNCPNPLAVQEKTTPAILTGNDVLVGTYTGSGKTLAFLVPLVQRLLWNLIDDSIDSDDGENKGIQKNELGLAVIIVAPGRELASQIVSVARDLLQDTGLTVQLAIGGTTFKRNLEQLRKRKPNIVVGTPGRIAELVVGKPGEKSGRLKVGKLQSLVLDEFDALLEYKAHRDPTHAIMQSLKRRHGNSLQSVLCSATATDIMNSSKVVDFLRPGFEKAMADEDDVLVTGAKTNNQNSAIAAQVSRTVIHGVINVPHKRMALDAVRKILHTEPIPQQILIFVENARKVDIVVEKLADRGIIAAPLHGGMGSEKMDRAEVSRALREGYVGIVVATEMAARGLDAPLLTHVINLDLPTDASHYAHRSGRCGRGGRPGVVINITTSPKERKVPKRFADTLGLEMFTAEARGGRLMLVDPTTQTIDQPR